MSDYTVVGAGIAGLVAARELVLQGHSVRILEESARAGGQLASVEIAGSRVDVGALQIEGKHIDAIDHLVSRVDGAPSRVTATTRPWWLSTSDGVYPLPAVHWWGVPSAPLAGDCVAITGRRAAWRGMLDAVLPGPRGAKAITLDELVRIRMGDGIAERLVAPVVEAMTGRPSTETLLGDVPGLRHRMLQQNSLARSVTSLRLDHAENAELATIEGGPSRLVDALLAELERFGVTIELETRVDAVTDDGIVVGGEERTCSVVLAAPLTVSQHGANAVATLVCDARAVPIGIRDAGVLAERGRRDGVRRVVDLTALWPGLMSHDSSRTVLRVEGTTAITLDHAVRAVSELWDTPHLDDALLGTNLSLWPCAAPPPSTRAQHPASVVAAVGEHVVGAGIARVISMTIDAVSTLAPDHPPPLERNGDAGV